MPDPTITQDPTVTARDEPRTDRDAGSPTRPGTDPAVAPPGERAYEDLPTEGMSQGPRSLGATEPADMGAPEGREPRPQEHVRDDGTGYRG